MGVKDTRAKWRTFPVEPTVGDGNHKKITHGKNREKTPGNQPHVGLLGEKGTKVFRIFF